MGVNKNVIRKARRIRMVLLDVDGVMTDGGIYYTAEGVEMKRFHAQDGLGINRARRLGIPTGIVSGRMAGAVDARARELQIVEVHQGVPDKLSLLAPLAAKYGLSPKEFAFMGDDVIDVPLMNAVGLAGAPANGQAAARDAADVVTRASGGNGAVREFLDIILDAQGL